MTLEEARQLKPGDRVLVEMVVAGESPVGIVDGCGYVWLIRGYAKPESIREKITPPRRMFKAGDIVRVTDDIPHASFIVREDERVATIKMWGEGIGFKYVNADKLTLICAVEDRRDRKEDEA